MVITPEQISAKIASLYIEANRTLPVPLVKALEEAGSRERSEPAKRALGIMLENLKHTNPLPICQDTGMAVVFCEWGGGVTLERGTLQEAVDAGIARACSEGYLRPSVVADPFRRVNTGDNTPAVLHVTLTAGEQVVFTVAPKGFGSENMTALRMFTPAATPEDISDFVVETVLAAGANPCPPVVIGVGLGGVSEQAVLAAKRALLIPPYMPNGTEFYARMEESILKRVNALGIGVQGFGGDTTALSVKISAHATHIAGLPCAVALGCWVTRHATSRIC